MRFQPKTDINDIEPLVDLINRAYRGIDGSHRWTTENHLVDGDRISADDLKGLISDKESDFIVGYTSGKIGACIAITYSQKFVEFGTFAVDPDLHGFGYGSKLLQYAEDAAKSKCQTFQVTVVSQNEKLIDFYIRRGYVKTGKNIQYPKNLNVGKPKIEDLHLTVLQKNA